MNPVKWRDITSLCQSAAGEMTDDQPMAAVEEFSLLDSMSAVELMDPKMDQCCGLTGSIVTKELMRFKGSNESGSVPPMSLAALLQVLFVYETSFLEGASLMETVHQCIFLWHDSWAQLEPIDQLTVQALLAFCKSLSLSLGGVFTGVLAADIFEDEDFQSGQREYLPAGFAESSAVEAEVKAVLTRLDAEAAADPRGVLGYVSCMLDSQLKLQLLFELIGQTTHASVSEYSRVLKKNQRAASQGAGTKEKASVGAATHLEQCAQIRSLATAAVTALRRLEAAHSGLSAREGEAVGDLSTYAGREDISFAFAPNLAKLVQICPVRHVPLKTFSQSVAHLVGLCEEVAKVCSLSVDILTANGSEESVLSFDELLSATLELSQRRVNVLTRSFFLSVLHSQYQNIQPMLVRSMRRRGLPSAVVTSDLVHNQWLEQNPASAAWETMKSLCFNRNRLMPRLDQCLTLWGAVANDSMFVDEQFRIQNDLGEAAVQWCSTWALTMTTQMMDAYLACVVEMDLVGVQEMDYFYWYWDYVLSTHSFAVERLRETRLNLDGELYRQAVLEADAAATKKSKAAGKKGKGGAREETMVRPALPRPMDSTLHEFQMKGRGHLCRGLFRVSVVAQQLGLVDKTENRFMSWASRFDLRFKAFAQVVNPPKLSYSDFLATLAKGSSDPAAAAAEGVTDLTKLKIDVATILNGASVCFQNARKFFDEIRRQPLVLYGDYEIQSESLVLTKVAVANSVAILKTSQLIPKPGAAAAEAPAVGHSLNRSYHRQYPVVEIGKRAV